MWKSLKISKQLKYHNLHRILVWEWDKLFLEFRPTFWPVSEMSVWISVLFLLGCYSTQSRNSSQTQQIVSPAQMQTAVTASLKSEQLLLLVFAWQFSHHSRSESARLTMTPPCLSHPANKRRSPNGGSMLAYRLWRWSTTNLTLDDHVEFAGSCLLADLRKWGASKQILILNRCWFNVGQTWDNINHIVQKLIVHRRNRHLFSN